MPKKPNRGRGKKRVIGCPENCPPAEVIPESEIQSGFVQASDFSIGDHTGVAGAVPAKSGDNTWLRHSVSEDGNWGADNRIEVPGEPTEVWQSYCFRLGDNVDINQTSLKLPGLYPNVTNQPTQGGGGGNGGGGQLAWSVRVQLDSQSFTGSTNAGNGMYAGMYYVYGTSYQNNPPFGSNQYWDGASGSTNGGDANVYIERNRWYCMTQHIKLNDINQDNGVLEGWIDGNLVYSRSGVNFTNNPMFAYVKWLWIQTYHGGGPTSNQDFDVFYDCFQYSIGPKNTTRCLCE